MQLKRDTEYALRIMTCMAEHLKDNGEDTGISYSSVLAKTGIPIVSFNRICKYLEEKELILKHTGKDGNKWLYPGKEFWEQSIFSIGKVIEGNMEIFVIFDRNTCFTKTYGNKLEETQRNLDQVLSKTTLEDMVEGRKRTV